MSKEAEILRKCNSCHDKHVPKSRKSRGVKSCISDVSVLQKVTLKLFQEIAADKLN